MFITMTKHAEIHAYVCYVQTHGNVHGNGDILQDHVEINAHVDVDVDAHVDVDVDADVDVDVDVDAHVDVDVDAHVDVMHM